MRKTKKQEKLLEQEQILLTGDDSPNSKKYLEQEKIILTREQFCTKGKIKKQY